MSNNNDKRRENRDAVAISVWENEGGALDRGDINHHYGRRREPAGSWTVYHVFTGAPAELEGWSTVGLEETDATATMILLNAHNAKRRKAASLQQTFATQFQTA